MKPEQPAGFARVPRQARSQRTLDALLDATEALLKERPFHDISVAELLARAEVSAGSFYARFEDKSALLHAVHERLALRSTEACAGLRRSAAAQAGVRGTAARSRAAGRRTARILVLSIVRGHRQSRGILRAVAIETFRDARFAERALRLMGELRDVACEAMRPFRGTRTIKQFDETVAFALRMVIATCDQLLFVPSTQAAWLERDHTTLGAGLTLAFVRHLQLE